MKISITFFILLITVNIVFSQEYTITIPGEKTKIGYRPMQIYSINKNDNRFSKNIFYVKTNEYYSLDDLNKNIIEITKIAKDKIIKIEKPFAKFEVGELLLKNNFISNIYKIYLKDEISWDISKLLQESGKFIYCHPEPIYKFNEFQVNDTYYTQQWALKSLNLSKFWDIYNGDTNVVIGIVDSGVFYDHLDLVNSIKYNYNEIPNDGIDNDKNGFIDDYIGWDFVGDVTYAEYLNGKLNPDNNPKPFSASNDHGTHVAGIASALTNNNIGISSPAFNSKFIPVKCTGDRFDNEVINGFEGILYCALRGADAINCSWLDFKYNPLINDILNQANSLGSIVVAAAGNANLDNYRFKFIYPSNLTQVISVGATDINNKPTDFTSYGYNVDIFAPGDDILSTVVSPNEYDEKSGTSMSSPLVASFVGILKNKFPDWDYKTIRMKIRQNVIPIKLNEWQEKEKYWGIINPLNLLDINHPGIIVNDYIIQENSYLDSVNKEYNLKILVKNVLETAQNIKYQIIQTNNFVDINQISKTKEYLIKNESDTINFRIKLNDSLPFFEGNLKFLLKITADNFENIEILTIPYKVSTSSKFLVAQTFYENYNFNWKKIHSYSKYGVWAIGNISFSDNYSILSYGNPVYTNLSKRPTAIFGINSNQALIALENKNDYSELSITNDAGRTFTTIDKPMALINYIYMYDKLNGIILGSPVSGYLGIRLTTDGGKTWKINPKVSGFGDIELANSKENGITFFMTNDLEFYISNNFGNTWDKISKPQLEIVQSILAYNNDTLMVIGFDWDSYNKYKNYIYSYVTFDKGQTWQKKDFLPNKDIIQCFQPENTNSVICQCADGSILKTNDFGSSWQFILTKDYEFTPYTSASLFIDSCGIRLWNISMNITFTDFPADFKDRNYNIDAAGQYNFVYDTINNNQEKQEILFLQNNGNSLLTIKNIEYNTKNISFVKNIKDQILPCELIDFKINYHPKNIGLNIDTLKIYFNEIEKNVNYYFKAYYYDPSSVKDNYKKDFYIYPNPVNDILNIETRKLITKLEIYDILGNKELEYFNYNGNNLISIDISKLSQGLKTLIINTQNNIYRDKIIKSR